MKILGRVADKLWPVALLAMVIVTPLLVHHSWKRHNEGRTWGKR